MCMIPHSETSGIILKLKLATVPTILKKKLMIMMKQVVTCVVVILGVNINIMVYSKQELYH